MSTENTESITDLLDRRAAREAAAIADARRELAELLVVNAYDEARSIAGHDYGAGQRANETRRRWRDAEHAIGSPYIDATQRAELERIYGNGDVGRDELTVAELEAAIARVLDPRVARIERESYRSGTPASKRTLEALRQTRQRLELHLAGKRREEEHAAREELRVAGALRR